MRQLASLVFVMILCVALVNAWPFDLFSDQVTVSDSVRADKEYSSDKQMIDIETPDGSKIGFTPVDSETVDLTDGSEYRNVRDRKVTYDGLYGADTVAEYTDDGTRVKEKITFNSNPYVGQNATFTFKINITGDYLVFGEQVYFHTNLVPRAVIERPWVESGADRLYLSIQFDGENYSFTVPDTWLADKTAFVIDPTVQYDDFSGTLINTSSWNITKIEIGGGGSAVTQPGGYIQVRASASGAGQEAHTYLELNQSSIFKFPSYDVQGYAFNATFVKSLFTTPDICECGFGIGYSPGTLYNYTGGSKTSTVIVKIDSRTGKAYAVVDNVAQPEITIGTSIGYNWPNFWCSAKTGSGDNCLFDLQIMNVSYDYEAVKSDAPIDSLYGSLAAFYKFTNYTVNYIPDNVTEDSVRYDQYLAPDSDTGGPNISTGYAQFNSTNYLTGGMTRNYSRLSVELYGNLTPGLTTYLLGIKNSVSNVQLYSASDGSFGYKFRTKEGGTGSGYITGVNYSKPVHLMFTYDGTTPRLYYDGAVGWLTTTSSATGILDTSLSNLTIGSNESSRLYGMAMNLSYVRVYNRSLSAAEVSARYAALESYEPAAFNVTILYENNLSIITHPVKIELKSDHSQASYETSTGNVLAFTGERGNFSLTAISPGWLPQLLYGYEFNPRSYAFESTGGLQNVTVLLSQNTSSTKFTALKGSGGAYLNGVFVRIYRIIGDTTYLVDSGYTDVMGSHQFYYDPTAKYNFVLSKGGYDTVNNITDPINKDEYLITMLFALGQGVQIDYSSIYYNITPTTYYSTRQNNFTFGMFSTYGKIQSFFVNATFPGGSVAANSSNAGGDVFLLPFNVTGGNMFDRVNVSFGYILLNGSGRNFTRSYEIVGYVANNGTIIKVKESLEGDSSMGILEKTLVGTLIVIFLAGAALVVGGTPTAIMVGGGAMSFMVYLGFIPLWGLLVAAPFGLLMLIARSN